MKTVCIDHFGQDHWSALAYIETCCIDNGGKPDLRRMRCNTTTHRNLVIMHPKWEKRWGTRAKNCVLPDHDDHDCARDLEKAGLLSIGGTGDNPAYELTPDGWRVISLLRQHKARRWQLRELLLSGAA